MNNANKVTEIGKKKIGLILLIGVFGAIILSGVKFMFSDVANRHGDYLYIRTIQIEEPVVSNKRDFDYKGFLESPANYYRFIYDEENGNFDFTKVDSAWNRKSEYEKMDWLKKNIKVTSYHDNVIEFAVHFDANITRDVDYMKEHGESLTNDFVERSEKSIKAVKPEVTFKSVGEENSLPIVEPINRKSMVIKFAIIGFVVGAFVAIFLLFLWSIAKENRES